MMWSSVLNVRACGARAGGSRAHVTAFSASTTVGVRRLSVEAAPELDDLLEDGAEQPGDGVEGDCVGALEVKPVGGAALLDQLGREVCTGKT